MEEQRKAACAEKLKQLDEKLGIIEKQPSPEELREREREKLAVLRGENKEGEELDTQGQVGEHRPPFRVFPF